MSKCAYRHMRLMKLSQDQLEKIREKLRELNVANYDEYMLFAINRDHNVPLEIVDHDEEDFSIYVITPKEFKFDDLIKEIERYSEFLPKFS